MDFIGDKEEKEHIAEIFHNATSTLKAEDQELECIQELLPMLQNGIAVHHSGLLPILKELIELLFQEGHVKVWAA